MAALARHHQLAKENNVAAHSYFRQLNDTSDPTGYWRWCIDKACARAANTVAWKRQRDEQRKKAGYESVVPD